MNASPRPVLLASLALAGLSLSSLAPTTQDGTGGQVPGMPAVRKKVNAGLAEKLEGAWRLMGVHLAGGRMVRENFVGYAMCVDGYLSILVHARDPDPSGLEPPELYVQSTFSQFGFGQTKELLTATLLGHDDFTSEEGEIVPEPINFPRRFQVEFFGTEMWLTRSDGSRYIFNRLLPGGFPEGAERLLFERRVRQVEGRDILER